MGVFRPILERTQSANRVELDHTHDKPVTPAHLMSASRPLYFGPKIARMLMSGGRYVTPYVMAMAISDMEGSLVARPLDVLFPGQGWGSTENGQVVDTVCDTSGLLMVCGAALRAPNVSLPAKAAVAGVLGTEGYKAAWAISSSVRYGAAGGEGRLDIPTSLDGKEAMVEKLVAVTFACATNDLDPGLARATLSAGALCFAGVGGLRGERARQMYQDQFVEIMSGLPAHQPPQA